MVKFTPEQLCNLMKFKNNIRNISIIAHVDHGKSTLADSLVASNQLLAEKDVGKARTTDTRKDEQEKGITIKSTGITLHYDLPEDLPLPKEAENRKFLVNLIDSPGHVDFSGEVTAALRLTDGALVLVDCVEGVRIQTETVLQQALRERIRPVLVMNKLDRCFTELKLEDEEIYQTLVRCLEGVNSIIQVHAKDSGLGNVELSPLEGTVAFTAAKMGWGFTVQQFARLYASQTKSDPEKWEKRLWGDHFYDSVKRKWSEANISETGEKLERGFCRFILRPIRQIFEACLDKNVKEIIQLLKKCDLLPKDKTEMEDKIAFDKFFVEEGETEKSEKEGKELLRIMLKRWIPASEAVLQVVALKLPSPVVAQAYRCELLYTGPQDNEVAKSIKACDPNGPLVMYISKMIPNKNNTRFYSFGRIFSGSVHSGQKVTILGPNFTPSSKEEGKTEHGTEDIFKNVSIQQVVLMMGRKIEKVDAVSAGNTCGLVGIDTYLSKTGTILSESLGSALLYPLASMKYSVSPVVQVAVEPKSASDLNKLVEGLKRLSKTDPLVQCRINEQTGEHIVGCVGELHLEICLNDLRDFMNGAAVQVSEPTVTFCETVTVDGKTCLAKSPNGHNRLFAHASPLSSELLKAIEDPAPGEPSLYQDKNRYKRLVNDFGWDATEAKKIWCFGPEDSGSNVLTDATHGVQYMNEIKDSAVAAFKWIANQGVLTESPLRGVKVSFNDALLHADTVHRGPGQIIPCARSVFLASQHVAEPRLVEPIFLVEIQCSEKALNGVYSSLNSRRGSVFDIAQKSGAFAIKAHLPVIESFGFTESLRQQTSGQAFPQCTFSHWQTMEESPFVTTGKVAALISSIRKKKGLAPEIPPLEKYLDKL